MNRALTKRSLARFKWMSAVFLGLVALVLLSDQVKAEPYEYNGEDFDSKDELEFDKGYIIEYTNKEEFCTR